MRIRVQVVIDGAEERAGEAAGTMVDEVANLERGSGEVVGPATLGLTLNEAKAILRRVQQVVVAAPAAAHVAARRRCRRRRAGRHGQSPPY